MMEGSSAHDQHSELRDLLAKRFLAPPETEWSQVEAWENAIYRRVERLEEQNENAEAQLRDIRRQMEELREQGHWPVSRLLEQLEAAEQKLTDIRAIDRGWPATMTDADKLKEVKRIAGRKASTPASSPSVCLCSDFKGNIHFDRALCACGAMHHYCDDCGWQVEPCDPEPNPASSTEEEA